MIVEKFGILVYQETTGVWIVNGIKMEAFAIFETTCGVKVITQDLIKCEPTVSQLVAQCVHYMASINQLPQVVVLALDEHEAMRIADLIAEMTTGDPIDIACGGRGYSRDELGIIACDMVYSEPKKEYA